MTEQELTQHIKRIIQHFFGKTHPINFYWTEEELRALKKLVFTPKLEEDFVESAQKVFLNHIPNVKIENHFTDSNRCGHADALVGCLYSEDISYYLLVCRYYPIVTLRPNFCCPGYYYSCLDEEWMTPSGDENLNRKVDKEISVLKQDFSRLLKSYSYTFLNYDSRIFHQKFRQGYIREIKIWDYLFYIGDS